MPLLYCLKDISGILSIHLLPGFTDLIIQKDRVRRFFAEFFLPVLYYVLRYDRWGESIKFIHVLVMYHYHNDKLGNYRGLPNRCIKLIKKIKQKYDFCLSLKNDNFYAPTTIFWYFDWLLINNTNYNYSKARCKATSESSFYLESKVGSSCKMQFIFDKDKITKNTFFQGESHCLLFLN